MIEDVVVNLARLQNKPWLVLGKGPGLDLRDCFDLDAYYTFSLNHACKVHSVTLAHFMDLEAFWECSDSLLGVNSSVSLPYVPEIALPWVPHKDMSPGHYNLSELIDSCRDRALTNASLRSKLWSYNSTRVPKHRWHKNLTTITVRYFSAVAAFNILAMAGHRKIYTLGIDGGTKYAKDFDIKHKLANGRANFDIQFKEINKTCNAYGIKRINLADKV